MLDLAALQSGLSFLFADPANWLWVLPGLLIGLIFGAIPGLSVTMAMAVFLPLTFYLNLVPAIIFLSAMFTGANFGGAIPSVLINIPGTASAVATTFDGHPMTRRGLYNEALGYALAASVLGTLVGYLLLLVALQPLGRLGLMLGPPELFLIVLWGITLIAAFSAGSMLKGLLAGSLGLLIATIGLSARGVTRGTLGIDVLLDGVPVLPAMMGLLAASELFRMIQRGDLVDAETRPAVTAGRILSAMGQVTGRVRDLGRVLYGGVIGTVIGAVPGVGSAVASLVSYNEVRRIDRAPESFGRGNPRGVMGAEAANSSSEGGSMAIMLCLGIPGGGATAVMLGAFSLHGVTGGPSFLAVHMDWAYAIIVSNFFQALLLLPVGFAFLYLAARVVMVPVAVVAPIIVVLAFIGAFALTNGLVGPVTMLLFGLIGWAMRLYGYPVAAMVIGLLLGRLAESNLLRTYQLGGGDLGYVLARPISLGLILALVLVVGLSLVRSGLFGGRPGRPAPGMEQEAP